MRRGSTRRFAHEPIDYEQLLAIMDRSTAEIPVDYAQVGPCLAECYLIVNAVEGLASGAYFYSREEGRIELLKAGEFRAQAGYLCLEQELGADASAVIFFLADLASILKRYGNRGYRLANLEAGIMGGRAYLCAYALGLGASGLTFYDDDVARFFSPHAEGKDAIFVTALGHSARGVVRPELLAPQPAPG
ncbi:MAG: SagB/ThcOx family dehydrogenase [Candidatus Rokubacteria bacterium]|nr:SagB/ThcOx family dehydrogenase [Candidatus Rokubacteria bacterium]